MYDYGYEQCVGDNQQEKDSDSDYIIATISDDSRVVNDQAFAVLQVGLSR